MFQQLCPRKRSVQRASQSERDLPPGPLVAFAPGRKSVFVRKTCELGKGQDAGFLAAAVQGNEMSNA